MNSIDIGRAFKAPFTDKDWIKKTLLGYLWMILVVTIPAVFGAQIEYIKRAAEGRDELPEWTDFGEKWVKGFMAGLAGFIYFLPVILGGILAAIPVATAASAGNSQNAVGVGVLVLYGLLALAYVIAVTLFFYAALTHYAMTDRFGAFFEFGEIFKRLRTGGYFTAWLFAWVISIAGSVVTSVFTTAFRGLGAVVSPAVSFLALMMTGNLLGQYASKAYGVARAPASMTPSPTYPPATAPPAYAPPTAPAQQPVYTPPPAPPAPPGEYTPPTSPPPPADYTPPTPPPPAYTPPAAPAYTPPAQPEYTPPAAPPEYTPPTEPPAPPPAEPAPPAPPAAPPES